RAVNVMTRIEPLNPPAGMVNGPHWGVALPGAGTRLEPTGAPLMVMLLVLAKVRSDGSESVTATLCAASMLSFSTVMTYITGPPAVALEAGGRQVEESPRQADRRGYALGHRRPHVGHGDDIGRRPAGDHLAGGRRGGHGQ